MPSHTFQISFPQPSIIPAFCVPPSNLSLSLSFKFEESCCFSDWKGDVPFQEREKKIPTALTSILSEKTWTLKKTGKHWEGDLWDPRCSNLLLLFDARFFFFPGSIGDGPVEPVLCRLWSSSTPCSSCECDALESNSLSLELRFWHQLQCTQRRKKERKNLSTIPTTTCQLTMRLKEGKCRAWE